jgi:hypothetical protein
VINTDENINIIILVIIPQEHLENADDKIRERLQILIRNALKVLNKFTFYKEAYFDGNSTIIIALAKYKKQLDERQRHHQ